MGSTPDLFWGAFCICEQFMNFAEKHKIIVDNRKKGDIIDLMKQPELYNERRKHNDNQLQINRDKRKQEF